MSGELLHQHDGTLTRLTLNRPTRANALSASLIEALLDAVNAAHSDGTRLLVLEGAGKHFCAGFDFTAYQDQSEGDLAMRFIRIETLLQTLHHAPFETMALAHGKIFGAGADLVATCNIRIAAPDTTFRMPGLRFGVVLGTQRLAHRVGADQAHALLSESRTFDAQSALNNHFLTALAEPAQWPAFTQCAHACAAQLTISAFTALHRQITPDTRLSDMSALAHSVSMPGIKERIRLYRENT